MSPLPSSFAAECVVEAESKDHMNWKLIGEVAKKLKGDEARASRKPTKRLKKKRTSTCITRWGGSRALA
jgi:hypothetical protein